MSEHRSERVIEGEARPEWARPPLVGVLVVGFLLVAIVGMASAAAPWLSNEDGGRSSPPAIVGQVLAVALAAGLCILLGLIWIHAPRRSKAKRRPGGAAILTEEFGSSLRASSIVLIGGVFVLVLFVLAFWFLLGQADLGQPPPLPGMTTGEVGVPPQQEPARSAPAVFDWFFFALVGSVAVALPLALVARRRLRGPDPEWEAEDVPESVVRALGDSIDQIERDPDARRSIIRAYARMEHAFDDAGIPRRPYEAPFEYLGRALRGLRVSPPAAGRLAALFERARFSQHVVGAETKDEAVDALREVERQMQERSP